MRVDLSRPGLSTPNTTAILRSQRASCVVQIFRYDNVDITKLVSLNASNEKSLVGANKPSSGNLNTRQPVIIKNDIIRCSINKNKGAASGNFTLVLKKGKQVQNGQTLQASIDYTQALHPGDWIAIYMKKNGDISDSDLGKITSDSGFKFLGIIENVRFVEVDGPERGQPRLEYVITGRDFGKVFETSLFFNPQVNKETIETVLGAKFLTDSSGIIKPIGGNTPDVVMKKVIKFFMGGEGTSTSGANDNWYIPRNLGTKFNPSLQKKSNGVSFIDILSLSNIGMHQYMAGRPQYVTTKDGPGFRSLSGATLIKALPSSGTIWSVMQFLQNEVVNELYTELLPDSQGKLRPSVVHRQVPFSNKKNQETNVLKAHSKYSKQAFPVKDEGLAKTYFVDLPKHEIVSTDVKQKNVGKSDHERINYILIVPKIDSSTFDLGYVAFSNIPSIQRYGLNPFQAQTSYILNQSDGIKTYLEDCGLLLQDWFFLSHNLYNGTIIVDGTDNHVPVGTNLYIKDDEQLFHIEGYTHQYQIVNDAVTEYTTEFRVSRGQIFTKTGISKFIGASQTPNDPTTVAVSFLPNERRSS